MTDDAKDAEADDPPPPPKPDPKLESPFKATLKPADPKLISHIQEAPETGSGSIEETPSAITEETTPPITEAGQTGDASDEAE